MLIISVAIPVLLVFKEKSSRVKLWAGLWLIVASIVAVTNLGGSPLKDFVIIFVAGWIRNEHPVLLALYGALFLFSGYLLYRFS